MSVEARARHRRGAAGHLRELRHRHAAGDAERRCRRALLEEWVGRETASFRLPPSRLALDPGDVVRLDHDGRLAALRLTSVADAGARAIEAVRTDASAYGLAPGSDRSPRAAEAGGLRAAGGGDPRPAAAPRGACRRTSRSRPCTPCPGRAASPSGAARARTASSWRRRSAGRRGWGGWSRRPLSRADLALRPRQRRDRRSRLRHARERHRPRALRRRQRAGGRGGARRLGGAAGRRRRADRAGALPALAAAARPARHRGRDRRPAPAGARVVVLDEALAPLPVARGGARARGQLALRAGVEAGQRPVLPAARASRPRASACGRSRSAMSSSRGARRASPAIS